ncbi:MAG: hypothetical protein QG657_1673 [Acidobacteriota bacterium]|nr:hypothetical protein [Acidobacteriota bacterium]
MTKICKRNMKHEEAGEEHLAVLIKQAGEEARKRKREAMDRHFKMLQSAIAEGLSRRKESIKA